MSTVHVPRRAPTQPRSEKSWTRAQVVEACGFKDPNAIYQLLAAHPVDPPCPCCGGFPRGFPPMGPGGYPRWNADKVREWLDRLHANAQLSERKASGA